MNRVGVGIEYTHTYAFPISDLLTDDTLRLSHLSVVGIVDTDKARVFKAKLGQIPVIHHLSGVEPAGIQGVNTDQMKHQEAISQVLDARWCLEDIGIWNVGPYALPYFATPVLCQEVLEQTVEGIKAIQEISSIPFAAEIPSFSIHAGDISLGDFFHQIIDQTNCHMVLDVSHVFSYAIYHALPFLDLLNSLPLDAVIEIHIAGGRVHPKHNWRYLDTHADPIIEPILTLLDAALKGCPQLRAVTFELGENIDEPTFRTDFKKIADICKANDYVAQLDLP